MARSHNEDTSAFNQLIQSGRFSHSRRVLADSVTLTANGSLVNFFDANGSTRIITLPALEEGRFYIIGNVGAANNLTVNDSGGTLVTTLLPEDMALLVASDAEWLALRGWAALAVFTNTVNGLVPAPNSAVPGSLFLRDDGQWGQVQVTGIVDAFKYMTDGTNTATGAGPDTFRLRSSSGKIGITVTDSEAVYGDNANFTVNEASVDHDALLNFVADEHVAHTGVTLTAGVGLSGGGDISANRTFDFAPSELTIVTPTLSDYVVWDLAAGGPRRVLWSTLNGVLDHDALLGFVANEHIDHSGVSIVASTGLSGGGDLTTSRSLALDINGLTADTPSVLDTFAFYDVSGSDHNKATIAVLNGVLDHNSLLNYVADQHVAHTGVTITAGAGLTGGGAIDASRTLTVGAGTGITVNADDVALDTTNTRNVDHASVSISTSEGIQGGGTIEATRTLKLDVGGLTADAAPTNSADYLATLDATDATHKKVLLSNLITTLSRELLLNGVISPAQITASQNNYAPTNMHTTSVMRLSTDASRTITGLDAGTAGEFKMLLNVGSFDIVLTSEDAASTAANRFVLNASVTISAAQGVIIWYDGTSSRWRVVGSTAAGGGGLDITGLTALTALDAADEVPVYDTSAAGNRKVTVTNFFKSLDTLTAKTTLATADEFTLYDSAATTAKKITFGNFETALESYLVSFATAQSLTDTQQAQARANIDVLKKNYIVNGAMQVSQENGTTSGTTDGYYPVDQFIVYRSTSGTVTSAQVASTTPAGSPNRIRVTATAADAAVAAGDYVVIVQNIEGLRTADLLFGSASAKSITIQFGVKAPAGTYCVTLVNSAANRSYVAEYTISGGEANTDVVKSVTFSGDTSGTWLATTGIGFRVKWGLMVGSTYQQTAGSWSTGNVFGSSNQFNFMGTINNVFELFDVSLTEGSAAPDYQVLDFNVDFLECQRYYCKSFALGTNPAQNVGLTGSLVGVAATTAAGSISYRQYWPVRMRTTPTVTTYNTNAANADWWDTNGAASRAVGLAEQSENSARIVMNAVTTAGSQHFIHWTANARM